MDSDRTRVRLLGSTIHHYHGHGRPSILVRRPSTRQRRENRGLEEYTIGFEVEKDCAINKNGSGAYGPGDLVDVTPLFAYWERDGSCGVEGVTHAYTLDNYPLFKKHVMKSEWLLRSPCAGLRERRDQDESRFGNPRRYSCGGHLTLAGPEERVTMPRIRNYSGLIYALYRPRLRNGFCDDNKDLASDGTRTHYAAIRSRGPGMIEFRIVRRVLSPHHLLWRFRLFRKVALAVKQDMPFGDFLRSVRPLLDEVYQLEDRREVESYAKKFDDYLTRGWVHEDIIPYI